MTVVGTVVRATAGVIVGIAILVVGARYVLGHHGGEGFGGGSPVSYVYHRLATKLDEWATGPGIVGLGLVTDSFPVHCSI